MTEVQERRRTDAAPQTRVQPSKRSRSARFRVSARIARRQVRRTWVSSLLIMTLIALPIAGMAGVAVYVASMIGSTEERVAVELGRMEAWVQPAGVPGEDFWQVPDQVWWTGYGTDMSSEVPEGAIPADPISALPAGTEVIPISEGDERIETAEGIGMVSAWAGSVWDPRFDGRFSLIDGRAPAASDEVLVTAATLDRIDGRIGGDLVLAGSGEVFAITGVFDAAVLADDHTAVAFFDADRFDAAQWYLPGLALDWPAVQALNDAGIVGYSREVVLDPPPFQLPDGQTYINAASQQLMNLLGLAAGLGAGGVAAAYMVVMLAGAAFAVSARRQQRALAIAASVGADAKDLRRTVLLQGTVLGLIAGGVGIAAGVGLGALVMAITDNGSATMFWGFHVPWLLLVGILVFAVLVGTASALIPARGVGRSDTISALRGARRPQKVTAARPLWGSLLLLVGVAVTIVSGIAAGAVAVNTELAYDSPLRWLPTAGIIGGPILAQIGILISGRWLLWLSSRALSTLGIAARIASRDAVANSARTVPAFAAIGATVFVGVFAVGLGTMSVAQSARDYTYSAPVGTANVSLYPTTEEPLTADTADRAAAAAEDALSAAGVDEATTVFRQESYWAETAAEIPADRVRATALFPETVLTQRGEEAGLQGYGWSEFEDSQNNITVVDVDGIELATGVELTAAQRQAYLAGGALVVDDGLVSDGTITVGAWTERQWMFGGAYDNLPRFAASFGGPGNGQDAAEPVQVERPAWERRLDAIVVDAPQSGITVAVSPETARSVGLAVVARALYGTFPDPPDQGDLDRFYALLEGAGTDEYGVSGWVESGPSGPESWLVPLLVAVAVLVVGASAVALGLARFERRPDDATLAAVGGTRGLRRRVGFWQGLVIAGFGTFAGAAAGILPPIGFWLQSQTAWQGTMDLADIPWLLLAVVGIALPLGIAAVNWLVPPRAPELTRRAVIA
ncbi:FtsX-like permease family protein [Microbacterium sp.]|uniref:FtsX-like permease family protein n=1 Tax=Microbacterium sp. TaxID=51671 RepID=UPI003734CF12